MAKTKDEKTERAVATNRRARHDYFIDGTVEAGLVLEGAEVKSLRAREVSIQEAYAAIHNGEVWIHGMRIRPYAAARFQPDPTRTRKLLLTRREIRKLERAVREKGNTLIPLKIYFNDRGLAKLQLGLCRGKRQYDKREAILDREYERRTQRALSERRQG